MTKLLFFCLSNFFFWGGNIQEDKALKFASYFVAGCMLCLAVVMVLLELYKFLRTRQAKKFESFDPHPEV